MWSYLTGKRGPSGFGSSSTAEEVAQGIPLASRTAIVTGATSGIGYETARVLVKQGACVIIAARNVKLAEETRDKIVKESPNADVVVLELDLSSLASVRKFAADFKALARPLNILINNAGVASKKFVLSAEGVELDFATNHLGHFLLVELLQDNMVKTATETGLEGRIVVVASEAHRFCPKGGIAFNKLNDEKSFSWMTSYGQSKLANILYANQLAKRLKEKNVNVTANSLHPGSIKTNLARDLNGALMRALFTLGAPFLKNVPQGTATTIYAAVHPSVAGVSGKYFMDCNEAGVSKYAKDAKLAEQLWDYSEKFVETHA